MDSHLTLRALERPAAGEPEGALVLLHGRGADEYDLHPLLDALDPERRLHGYTPRAPLALPPGGAHWYAVPRVGYPDPETFREGYARLTEWFDALPFPAERIALGGFSQGSLMSLDVGLRYPYRLAGIVGISGYVADPEHLIQDLSPVAFQQRLLMTHGVLDPLIPFAVVREQVNLLKAAGLHIQWHEFVKPHTIAGEPEIEVIRNFIQGCYE